MKLRRKVAILTGAAAGIGSAAARLFVSEGARLVLVDADAQALSSITSEIEESSPHVLDIVADVSGAEACAGIIQKTMARFGHLDALFHNAGIVAAGPLAEYTAEDWQQTLDTNLKSTSQLCREAISMMQNQGGGCIINLASVAGAHGVADDEAYSASKAGVIRITKSLAKDFVSDGIRVNCICPGTVDTPSLRAQILRTSKPEESSKAFVARQPMGRMGTVEEIAALALFLASDDSRFMTGQAIVMDGGMTL